MDTDLDLDLDEINIEDILTTAQAARRAGVLPSAITNWRERGYINHNGDREHLPNIGTKERPRYLVRDVVRAEHATRDRSGIRRNPLIAAKQFMSDPALIAAAASARREAAA